MINVLQQMKTWPARMHTYNKLRTPYIDTARQDMTTAPKFTVRSFQNYTEKYKVALETCASVGVQSCSTEITGNTQSVHWYVIGELFLLLVSSLSFFWARIVKEHTDEKEDGTDKFTYFAVYNAQHKLL